MNRDTNQVNTDSDDNRCSKVLMSWFTTVSFLSASTYTWGVQEQLRKMKVFYGDTVTLIIIIIRL